MKLLYSLILFFPFMKSSGQESPYKFSYQIDSILQHDTVSWKHEIAAWDYSFIGEYAKALKTFDDKYKGKRGVMSKAGSAYYLKEAEAKLAPYKPIPASDYIINEAKKTRLVIINEAHHVPRHRTFVEDLLPELQKLGYQFMGIETLDYRDSLLLQRKYPVLISGTYSQEPCFGNLIRTALQTNFYLFPYEAYGNANGKEREIQQAENIKKVMDKNPNGKFIIYCGFGHVIEDSTNNSWLLAMAGRLKNLTGINPLTIDQVELTERGEPDNDNVIRKAIHLNYSAVFIDSNGKAFNKAVDEQTYDANVYHPDTKLINGRPDWLQTKDKKAVTISTRITINYPCLVMAYNKEDDPDNAVPVDIIELKDKNDKKKLVLTKTGKHTVIIKNKEGQKQIINQ